MTSHPSRVGIQGGLLFKGGHLVRWLTLGLSASLLLMGCHANTSGSGALTPSSVERGRIIYQTQCIACHNPNPHKAGSLGPDIFGSSKELIEARILRGSYPPGYKPKRETHTMAALPHLKHEIESLHAFLNIIE